MLLSELKNYDFVFGVDSSGSMSRPDTNGKTRWNNSKETGYAVASKMAEFDSDGIDVIRFGGSVEVHQGVTPAKVDEVYARDPQGGTPLHLAIREARKLHESRRLTGSEKTGTILAIVTDGVPDDPKAVEDEIISLSNSLTKDSDFGIQILQVGNDAEATKYLKNLDDSLQGKGAKFDIVDTKTFDDLNGLSLTDALIDSLTD